jgi:ferredoxin
MYKVSVEPSGIVFFAHDGETVMAAARRNGYSWPTICGGKGECVACVCDVKDNATALSPISKSEKSAIAEKFLIGGNSATVRRLACQAVVSGDVALFKRGVRRTPSPEEGKP